MARSDEERRKYAREYARASRAANPEKHRKYQREFIRARRAADPEKYAAYQRKWSGENKEHRRRHARKTNLKKLYGLTLEQFDAMFAAQGSCCAICKSVSSGWKGGWHVDHDHITKMVRGILCSHCNALLSRAKDMVSVLSAAIDYLAKYTHVKP